MKKTATLILLCTMMCTVYAHAQDNTGTTAGNSISLKYKMVDNDDVNRLMDFLKIYRLDVSVRGEGLKGRKFKMVTVTCRDGVFSESGGEESDIAFSAYSDTLDFVFFAQQISPDSVRISWNGEVAVSTKDFPVPGSTHPILMETYSSVQYTDKDSIPIMAYSTGQLLEFDLGDGNKGTTIYYCGLRDAKVHPREWPAKYGIKDFVYFYIIFPEE